MGLRSARLVAGWPLLCRALTEGPCSLPEQTLICPPEWVAVAWAASGTALTLLFTHPGPGFLVVFQGGGPQREE